MQMVKVQVAKAATTQVSEMWRVVRVQVAVVRAQVLVRVVRVQRQSLSDDGAQFGGGIGGTTKAAVESALSRARRRASRLEELSQRSETSRVRLQKVLKRALKDAGLHR